MVQIGGGMLEVYPDQLYHILIAAENKLSADLLALFEEPLRRWKEGAAAVHEEVEDRRIEIAMIRSSLQLAHDLRLMIPYKRAHQPVEDQDNSTG